MSDPYILLVEDNPTDEALTCRVLRKSRLLNEIVVVRDGAEALDFLFARSRYEGRQVTDLPHVALLRFKAPSTWLIVAGAAVGLGAHAAGLAR